MPPGLSTHTSATTTGPTVPCKWEYVDDSNAVQGPFADATMRNWMRGGYLRDDVLIRCVEPSAGLRPAQLGDAAGLPLLFLPLFELFPAPETAFGGGFAWLAAYLAVAPYQSLLQQAADMDIDDDVASDVVTHMRANGIPPDLTIMLDLVHRHQATGGQLGAAGATAGGTGLAAGTRQQPPSTGAGETTGGFLALAAAAALVGWM